MRNIGTCLLFLLIISLTVCLIPRVTSQTEAVEILNYTCYVDSIGYLVIIGEVQNTGSNVLEYVQMLATVTTPDGNQLQSGNAVWASKLLSGQKAPFYIEVYPQSISPTSWEGVDVDDISLSIYQSPTTTEYQYQYIEIKSSQAAPKANGEYWVNGELVNTGDESARNIVVVATFYNSEGLPIAAGYIDPIATIAAGSTSTFKVPALDLNQTIITSDRKIVSYSLLIQVESPILTGDAPIITDPLTPIPGLNTQVTLGTENILLYTVVIVLAILVVLVTLVLIRKRKTKQESRSGFFIPKKPAKKQDKKKKKRLNL